MADFFARSLTEHAARKARSSGWGRSKIERSPRYTP